MFSFYHVFLLVRFTVISSILLPIFAQLTPDFYDEVCSQALPTIKLVVENAIAVDPRTGASLLRLHFHDCFVNGCDASVLLDDTPTFTGEKTARPNSKSARGFDVIDSIKSAVNLVCLDNVVSCSDILAAAARDSVVALGGAPYDVLLGRRDATTASIDAANNDLPTPFLDFPQLLANFDAHGLTLQDLVVLSGAHTLGFAKCFSFRSRIYNETATIDNGFAGALQMQCPITGGDSNLEPLDESPANFDTGYFKDLMQFQGLLHSDQQLFQGDGGASDALVAYYAENLESFLSDFSDAMIKMGNMSPLTGTDGEIRQDCRVVNQS